MRPLSHFRCLAHQSCKRLWHAQERPTPITLSWPAASSKRIPEVLSRARPSIPCGKPLMLPNQVLSRSRPGVPCGKPLMLPSQVPSRSRPGNPCGKPLMLPNQALSKSRPGIPCGKPLILPYQVLSRSRPAIPCGKPLTLPNQKKISRKRFRGGIPPPEIFLRGGAYQRQVIAFRFPKFLHWCSGVLVRLRPCQ